MANAEPTGTISTDDAGEIATGWQQVAEQEVSKHRWYTKKLIVFRDSEGEVMPDDGLYGFYYLDPASELQEDQDRFESDPVKVFSVSAREVVSTVYEVTA